MVAVAVRLAQSPKLRKFFIHCFSILPIVSSAKGENNCEQVLCDQALAKSINKSLPKAEPFYGQPH